MDWTWFLFSFKGRISRGKLWLALLVILCGMSLLAGLAAGLSKLLGGPASFSFNLNDAFATLDPDTYRVLSRADLMPAVVHVVGTPLFVWVYVATGVKRLHDRNRSGWWMLVFFLIPGLLEQFSDRLDGPYAIANALAITLLYLWGFIEMYCLRGDRWSNRFGPDPLPKVQVRARSDQPRGLPAWDQNSELEFMPRIVGAPPPRAHIGSTSPPVK